MTTIAFLDLDWYVTHTSQGDYRWLKTTPSEQNDIHTCAHGTRTLTFTASDFLPTFRSELFFPVGCFDGGYLLRLNVISFFPPILIFFCVCVMLTFAFFSSLLGFKGARKVDAAHEEQVGTGSLRRSSSRRLSAAVASEKMTWTKRRLVNALPMALLIIFVMLPAISRAIFSAWDCIPIDAGGGDDTYFLRVDRSVECGSSEHRRITRLAIVLTLIWPVGMPFFFFYVLFVNRKVLRTGGMNALAKATTFLTGGYKKEVY